MASWQCSLFDTLTTTDDVGLGTSCPSTSGDPRAAGGTATRAGTAARAGTATRAGTVDATYRGCSPDRYPPEIPGSRRMALADGAWVEHQPSWLAGSESLARRLGATVPWQAERRVMYGRTVDVPRLQCFYDEDCPLPDPQLERARLQISERYGADLGEPLCTTGLCLYRDGRDSVAWHGDTIGRGATEDTVVAILSLGATRRLLLRRRGGGRALRFTLRSGDLLVMGGSCQRTWEHAVPKTALATGPRVSVQFRARGVR